jgi:hypothetical protein
MKRKYLLSAVLLLSTIIYSCDKTDIQTIDAPVKATGIKFFNFAVSSPVVNYFANDIKVSSAVSTTGAESGTTGLTYGTVYPANNAYATIDPGLYDFKATRPSTAAAADRNVVLNKLTANVAEGKSYSLYMCGFYNSTAKTTDAFLMEDVLPPIDTGFAYVRFVHVSPNANPIDFYMRLKEAPGTEISVAKNIAFKSGSAFVKVPQGVYSLIVRYVNTAGDVVIRDDVSALKSNVYTFSLRGDITIGGTTDAKRRFIDNTPNR